MTMAETIGTGILIVAVIVVLFSDHIGFMVSYALSRFGDRHFRE